MREGSCRQSQRCTNAQTLATVSDPMVSQFTGRSLFDKATGYLAIQDAINLNVGRTFKPMSVHHFSQPPARIGKGVEVAHGTARAAPHSSGLCEASTSSNDECRATLFTSLSASENRCQ